MLVEFTPSTIEQTSLRFILELARALHAYGTPAHRLEVMLIAVAERLGLQAEFFSTPTSIMVGFGSSIDQRVHLLRVDPGAPNLGHLSRLADITRAVLDNELTAAQGLDRLSALKTEAERWPTWLVIAAYVLASASVACFLKLRGGEVLVASILGLVTAGVDLFCIRYSAFTNVKEALAAFVVTTLALAIDVMTHSGAGYLTSLAGLIVLLPGLTFTVALTELSSRHLASGTARLSGALVVFLGLAFGLALGAELGTYIGLWLRDALDLVQHAPIVGPVLPGWAEWLALLIAPLAFTVLLKADKRDAGLIVIACAVAYIVSRVAGDATGEELGAFLGAFAVSAGSNILGKYLRRSPMITIVPGLLILVPGSIGFRSVTSMLGAETELGIAAAFRVAIIGISLAAGILAGNVVMNRGDGSRM